MFRASCSVDDAYEAYKRLVVFQIQCFGKLLKSMADESNGDLLRDVVASVDWCGDSFREIGVMRDPLEEGPGLWFPKLWLPLGMGNTVVVIAVGSLEGDSPTNDAAGDVDWVLFTEDVLLTPVNGAFACPINTKKCY